MKKILAAMIGFVMFGSLLIIAPNKSEAQPAWGGYCCDASWIRRCVVPAAPIGVGCFCYGQGSGFVCQ